MKQVVFSTILLITQLLLSSFVKANTESSTEEDNKNKTISVSAGIVLTHFEPTFHLDKSKLLNYGAEVLFNYPIVNKTNFTTGINYQYGGISEYNSNIKTGEIAVPLLVSYHIFPIRKDQITLTTGVFFGSYFRIKRNQGSPKVIFEGDLFASEDHNMADFLSAEDLITDFYISLGDKRIFQFPFGFEVFYRYRLKKHDFINQQIHRSLYGLSIKYHFPKSN